jgi:hypothetical protein
MYNKPVKKGPPDFKINPISRQFYRPYFSPHTNSYEMDIIETADENKNYLWWLFVVNINTRFLLVHSLRPNKDATYADVVEALENIQNALPQDQRIMYLRSDAGPYFGKIVDASYKYDKRNIQGVLFAATKESKPFLDFLANNRIVHYVSRSPFVNRSRIIDRVARTIRDMLGEDPRNILIIKKTRDAVIEYNNTPHIAFKYIFTPAEVQSNKDIEGYFIREQLYKLEEIKNRQAEAGFFNYKPGDILLIHRDNSKLGYTQYNKKRRVFNRVARFIRYIHGNVECVIYERGEHGPPEVSKTSIILPIYHTRLIAHSLAELPPAYSTLIF